MMPALRRDFGGSGEGAGTIRRKVAPWEVLGPWSQTAPRSVREPAARAARGPRGAGPAGSGRDGGAPGRALGHVEVGDRALGRLGGEADRLRQGRMRMDGEADVLGVRAHLERVHRL